MHIVTEVPGAGPLQHARRFVVVLLGYLLFLAGLLLAVPTIPFAVLAPIAWLTGDEVSIRAWGALIGLVVATVLCLRLGLRLIRGRRHLVLFLRRFGFDDATETLTYAVDSALGRRWRLVTLDDSEVAPLGIGRGSRILWGTGRWISLLLLAGVIAYAVYWVQGGGMDSFLEGIMDSAFEQAEESTDNVFEALIAGAVAALIMGLIALTILFLLAALLISVLGIAAFGFWRGDRAVRQAEERKAQTLDSRAAVERTVRRIRAHSGRIFAPRLVVLRVHDSIWRDAVHELARDAAVALIDVSEPTEHLLWEVELLQSEESMRMLPIGRRDLVEEIVRASDRSLDGRLRARLEGVDVLVYEADGRRGAMGRFARNLGAALERSVA